MVLQPGGERFGGVGDMEKGKRQLPMVIQALCIGGDENDTKTTDTKLHGLLK